MLSEVSRRRQLRTPTGRARQPLLACRMDWDGQGLLKAVHDIIDSAAEPADSPVGWTVCLRDGRGRQVAARFKVRTHDQVNRLALQLAHFGYFLTIEQAADCDFVFGPQQVH
ncbi:hypothetical protein ACPWT1_20210 [Ramlibacter sp. MMS24-I3-19]|uniref:hypothetical protein n=1 Tax=Ramlibacter sp. MMS24-I3-19 TaxID=3416606 RepID=UPI003D04C5C6